MNTEHERADFEAWYEWEYSEAMPCGYSPHGYYLDARIQLLFRCWQAGRATLQSQSMPPEISRDLLGKIVDEVFDGAIEDASVIEDIYRVVARECALQSQDREPCTWKYDKAIDAYDTACGNAFIVGEGTPAENDMKFCCYCGGVLTEAIDHARRIEGES